MLKIEGGGEWLSAPATLPEVGINPVEEVVLSVMLITHGRLSPPRYLRDFVSLSFLMLYLTIDNGIFVSLWIK